MSKFYAVLKNRNFFFLWIGQIISEFGERITQMALIGFVYQKSPYSAVALAKLLMFIVVPVFLIGPVAGVYVDRWDRRYTMIISDILRSLFVVLIPLSILFFHRQLVLVYILVFLIFSTTRFFLPSKMAIIPDLVEREHLLMANSLVSTTRMIATVVGLGFAGVLVGFIGPLGGFYINAATFLFSAAMLSLVSLKKGRMHLKKDLVETGHALEEALVKRNIFGQIKEGIKFLLAEEKVRFSMQSLFLVMAGLGAMSVVTIVFIQENFGSATKEIGFFAMLTGLGLFFGSVCYGRIGSRISKKKAMCISFIASGLAIAFFVFTAKNTHMVSLAGICAFLLGLSASPIVISSHTLIHEAIPHKVRGRVFSSVEVIIHLAFLTCMFLAAKTSDLFSRAAVLTACAGIFVLFGLAGLIKESIWKT